MSDSTPHARRSLWAMIAAAGPRHWLIVAMLTLAGLLLAELPLLPRIRDRVYMWLQWEIHRPEKRVIVVAIDNEEYWRGAPGGVEPLNRTYLATLLRQIAAADPDVIGVDVGLQSRAAANIVENPQLLGDTETLLTTINEIAQKCPVVLAKTISGPTAPFHPQHDVFDTWRFHPDAEVSFGHTSPARDIRQIPTRVPLDINQRFLDSFALAIFRATTRDDVPPAYDDADHPWPFSLFLPAQAFTPRSRARNRESLLTPAEIRGATPKQLRRWLRGQIVIVGGTWHRSLHSTSPDTYEDGRQTPLGWLPGVLTHANYVQSLLWKPMFPMSETWRIGLEIALSVGISLIFLRARGWRRARLIILTIGILVVLTWMFRAVIGRFFDLVIPVTFLGVHVLCEEAAERFALVPRHPLRHGRRLLNAALVVVSAVLTVILVVHTRGRAHHRLDTEHRLQVAGLLPVNAQPFTPPLPERTQPETPQYADIPIVPYKRSIGTISSKRTVNREVATFSVSRPNRSWSLLFPSEPGLVSFLWSPDRDDSRASNSIMHFAGHSIWQPAMTVSDWLYSAPDRHRLEGSRDIFKWDATSRVDLGLPEFRWTSTHPRVPKTVLGSYIRGVASAADDSSLPGVTVELLDCAACPSTCSCASSAVAHTVTDANGEYRFGPLAEGTYMVRAALSGLQNQDARIELAGTGSNLFVQHFPMRYAAQDSITVSAEVFVPYPNPEVPQTSPVTPTSTDVSPPPPPP